jgi:two-component system chemotaxis sensor kinase CheA
MNLVEDLAINRLHLAEVSVRYDDAELRSIIDSLSRLTDELQNEIMETRLIPVSQVFDRFPRIVRDVAKDTGKRVRFEITGQDIKLDRTVLDEIGDPLIHMLRNAVDHGIEAPDVRKRSGKPEEGELSLVARREKSHVFIEVSDDGAGMDADEIRRSAVEKGLATAEQAAAMSQDDILLLTATPGFSTKNEVTEISGRGVGLDVAKRTAENLGGSLLISSKPGQGTSITMRLPVTTAVVKALLVGAGGRTFAIPISNITEIVACTEEDVKRVEHQQTILNRGQVLPLVRLSSLFGFDTTKGDKLNVVVIEFGGKRFGIAVDTLRSQQDIVIKQLAKDLKGVKGFAGATIMGDGKVALVLDVATLI